MTARETLTRMLASIDPIIGIPNGDAVLIQTMATLAVAEQLERIADSLDKQNQTV